MSVRFVNSSVPYQDGKGTFQSIQQAINASAVGDTVVLEDNQVYDLGSGQVILKNGVDLVCRNGVAQIQSTNSVATVTDNNIASTCNLINLSLLNTSAFGGVSTSALYIQHGSSAIYCSNVKVQATGAGGCAGADIRGYIRGLTGISPAGGYGIFCFNGEIELSKGQGAGIGILNTGKISHCIGVSSATHGILNTQGGLAFQSKGFSSQAGGPGFKNEIGSYAIQCSGHNDHQCGFENKTNSLAQDCVGISTGTLGGGASVGFNNGVSAGGDISIAQNCVGISTQATGGEGFNSYPDSIALGCRGYSKQLEGFSALGAYAENCSGTSGGAQVGGCPGISAFNAVVFGGKDQGATLVNCSGFSDTREALLIQGNNNKVIGGSYQSIYNNAAGHGINISDNPVAATGTEIYNVTIHCLNAGASSIVTGTNPTNVKYAGLIANRAVGVGVVQALATVVDAQGNVLG